MTRYVLGERIGIGGMAEVFRAKATAPGGFEKPVAIKRILPHLSQDKRFVDLLIQEAKLLSQLRHRNIVQIFDVGLGSDGQYFLVMEYVDGADVSTVFEALQARKRRLPVDLALHVGAEVCEALHHAHQAEGSDGDPLHLVHRDVSPANILMSRSGEVKLTDFGIAKQKEEATGHGTVRGKFAYISPEQAANERVDARSDVFALAVVLYELILGHRLFSGMADFDALKAVRAGVIRGPREIDPTISPKLEAVLMRALAHDPNQRFSAASEFGSELRGMRYAMPTTGVDPAKELSRVLQKYVTEGADVRMGDREPTIVRVRTAVGFGMTPFDAGLTEVEDDDAPFDGAAAAFDAFDSFDEDEKTTHLQPGERMAMTERHAGGRGAIEKPTVQVDTLSQQQLLAAERAETAREQLAVIPATERAATPTVKDQFHAQKLLRNPPSPRLKVSETLYAEAKRSRRRALMWMVLAALIVAAGSFVIASEFVNGSSEDSSDVDAGMADARTPDTVPPSPDAMAKKEPANKKKPVRNKRRRKRRR